MVSITLLSLGNICFSGAVKGNQYRISSLSSSLSLLESDRMLQESKRSDIQTIKNKTENFEIFLKNLDRKGEKQ